jgi:hypothetical protein
MSELAGRRHVALQQANENGMVQQVGGISHVVCMGRAIQLMD